MTISKRLIAGLTLAALLGIGVTGCKQTATQAAGPGDAKQTQTEQVARQNVIARSSHECGAPTKAGGKCTRRVADKNGVDAKCWQHRDKPAPAK